MRALVAPHLFYVVQLAGELRHRHLPFEELLAEGNIGLVEAAHRYDPTLDVKFLTYASWWIRKRMLECLMREGGAVRLTRHARSVRRELGLARDALRGDFGRDPTVEELVRFTGFRPDVVHRHLSGPPRCCSLDQPAHPISRRVLIETLADDDVSPEEALVKRRARQIVRREVARLSDREQLIVKNRFGIDGREPMTFEELGAQLGVSRERARQLEREALQRLRRRLGSRMARPATAQRAAAPVGQPPLP